MNNILITGGAGFIGSHVVRRFVNNYPNYLDVKSRMIRCVESQNYFISSLEDIEKCFFYESKTGQCYATAFKIVGLLLTFLIY